MKTSRSTFAIIAGLITASVWVASKNEIQLGGVAALLGYGTVLTILVMLSNDYRGVSRRFMAK